MFLSNVYFIRNSNYEKQDGCQIKGSWVSCSQCGVELEYGKDRFNQYDNLICDPIYLCEICMNGIKQDYKTVVDTQ